jgi:30S ribosomal protein S31
MLVGKGDRRTRRGKIYAGSFGKLRPKAAKKDTKAARPAAAAKPAKAPAKTPAKRAKA